MREIMREVNSQDPEVCCPSSWRRKVRLRKWFWPRDRLPVFAVAVPNGYAQWAVIDVANLIQSLQQYLQMSSSSRSSNRSSRIEDPVRGHHRELRIGGLGQAEALGAQAIVPRFGQEVVKLQQEGKYETKMTYYEGLMKAVDPALLPRTGAATRSVQAELRQYRAAFAVTDADYDAVEIHGRTSSS